jgi:hypothetical protein
MSLFYMMHGVGRTAGSVTLTNASLSDTDFSAAGSAITSIFYNADGTVDKLEGAITTQLNPSTDWIVPNSGSATTYYIRATQVSLVENETNPSIFSTLSGDSLATWHTLGNGQGREFRLTTNSNTAGDGDITWQITIEIASDSGGTDILDSCTITMQGFV